MQEPTFNPYRPPEARVDPWAQPVQSDDDVAWSDGRDLVVLLNKPLPPRCVKCNAPVSGGIPTRKFHWHTPWLYLLILVGILIYAIVALITRKKSEHAVALCPTHDKRRRMFIYAGFGGFFLGMFMAFSQSDFAGLGILLMLAAILVGMFGSRIMVATKMDERYVRFRGVSKAFLASLPPLPAHRRRY